MSAENTKNHFAEICEYIWNKIQGQEKLDRKTAAAMRNFVVNFSMVAWNACIIHNTFADAKKFLHKFADENFDGDQCALLPLLDAAELKWREYRNDKNIIAGAEVKTVNGKPQVIAYLKDECPEVSAAFKPFHDLMQSPEVQERLKNTPPEKLEEEIGKIIAEYNASLPAVTPDEDWFEGNDEDEGEYRPIGGEELHEIYQRIQCNYSRKEKKGCLKEIIDTFPFLSILNPLSDKNFKTSGKNKTGEDLLSNLIITIFSAFVQDTALPMADEDDYSHFLEEAEALADDFIQDEDDFYYAIQIRSESAVLSFIAETVAKLNLPTEEYRRTLSVLLTWGVMLECAREAQYFAVDDESSEPESYDFDKENLRVFQLHVKLRGFRVSADILVREDSTFEELHNLINTLFQRDDDHLYRFECEDGCTAVRDEIDIDDDELLAGECYIGHHLSEDCGAYYLFDYGDEWEHDITVKKIVSADTKEKYPKVLKIRGNIPEQYS